MQLFQAGFHVVQTSDVLVKSPDSSHVGFARWQVVGDNTLLKELVDIIRGSAGVDHGGFSHGPIRRGAKLQRTPGNCARFARIITYLVVKFSGHLEAIDGPQDFVGASAHRPRMKGHQLEDFVRVHNEESATRVRYARKVVPISGFNQAELEGHFSVFIGQQGDGELFQLVVRLDIGSPRVQQADILTGDSQKFDISSLKLVVVLGQGPHFRGTNRGEGRRVGEKEAPGVT